MKTRYFAYAAPAAIAVALMPASALAQTTPAAAQTAATQTADAPVPASTIEEIVVTAQKRRETAQSVPLSITALSASTLKTQGIQDVNGLSAMTPGLSFGRVGPGNGTPFLRGIGSNVASPGAEAAVSTYVDGVYIGSQYAPIFSFNNIASIEIDKGPQGTLFGRNATGGVIQITTREPTQAPRIDAEVGYGNYNTLDGRLYMSTGITSNLAADVAVYAHDQIDGWGHNLYNGQNVYTNQDYSVRSKWVWTPDDRTKVTTIFSYSHDKQDVGTAGSILEGEYFRPPGSAGNPGPILASYHGFYNTDENSPAFSLSNQGGVSLKIVHDFDAVQVVSISSYLRTIIHGPIDSDLSEANWKALDTHPASATETQEFQILSPDNPAARLKWIVGGFFYHDNTTDDPFNLVGYGYSSLANITINAYQHTTSFAGFGQATYKLFTDTNVTLGLRETTDHRSTSGTECLDLPTGCHLLAQTTLPGSTTASPRTANFSKPTWKFAVDQHFTRDILAYVSYSRGFKAGVFNTVSLNTAAVQPETVDAFEVGLKSEFLDHRLRINLAGYHESYRNIQFSAFTNGLYVLGNAAAAKIDGLDFEVVGKPVDRLTLSASGTLLNPRYTSFPGGPGYVPVPITSINPSGGMGGFQLVSTDLSGKQMIQASKETVNLNAVYDFPLIGGDLQLAGLVQHRSKYFFDPQNGTEQPAFTQANASAQWNAPGNRWYVRAFVNNLTNRKLYANITRSTSGDWAVPAPPRMYGVAFGVHM